MAAPPVARPTPDGSADGHPIEAHLEAERAALHAERAAAAAALAADQRRDRWHLLRAAGLGFLLAGAIAVGWNQTHQDEPLGEDVHRGRPRHRRRRAPHQGPGAGLRLGRRRRQPGHPSTASSPPG